MNRPLRHSEHQSPQQFRPPFQMPSSQSGSEPQHQQLPQHQPHMPPRKPKSRNRHWLIICIVVLVLIVIGAAFRVGKSNQATTMSKATQPASTVQQQQTTKQPAPKPTSAKSSPTSTVITNAGAPVLGGTLSAFIAKFGQPNDHSSNGMPHFQRCGNSNVDQLILSQISRDNTSDSITSIVVQACTSTSWYLAQATAVCLSYFPSDAKYQRSVQIVGTRGQFASVDKIYYSATLAHVFAMDNFKFTDVNGKAVQPGLFDVDYRPNSNNDTSYIDSCTIQLGTQQTNG